ncbi:trypsin-like peptidase domain-containing protein [Butyrivibrio sp. INlla14]|uniref:trypsin-like peptidase domain-containing protein n=1 Tax=Butyrivibrio sp. INlla14 TaxID=1520808 RepID=UPI000B872802|nr:trypsin-like peptidase domain-containing protein [Butyrivibrio sp. INlla14]
MGKQEMSDQYYERLKKCGCKISIDKNDVGTGWICADNLALTAGHLFGNIDEHSKITLDSCGVSSDAHIISRHHDDKHDYALLAIDKKFSTYMPILFEKPSDINSLSNVATYCFSSTVNHEMVNASGKINGETSETKYLKILSKEIGDNGNSGAPIYSLDKQAICGIQSLAASSKYSAESNTSLAFPTWEICDCDKEKIMAASVGELPQKAFELSEPFIKESSYKLLSVKSGKKFRAYTDALNSDEGLVKNISDLFLSCSRCMEYESVVKKHKADLGSATLLEWVSKRIEGRGTTGDGKHILNVVGTCGSGKTTFLGIEYFYLLNKFVTGKSLYVPFYFNIEDLLRRDELEFSNENVEPSTIQESILKYFDDFMEKSREVLGEYSHGKKINAVYILDGFDDGNFLSDDVYIDGDIFEHAQNISEKDDRIITAVNTYNYIQYSKKWDKYSGCVIYINEVNVIYDGIRARRFNRFIESYLALNKIRDERKISKVKDIIRKYKKSQISLNFMYKNYESISEMAANPSLGAEVIKYYRNIMKDDIERQFGKNYGNFINQAAYFWYFYGEKYDKLNELSEDNKISYATFCKIKSKPELCKYLISQYYVQEVINYKQLASSGVEIAQNSILRMFISRDISTMIRRELQNKPEAINALSIGLDKVPPQMKSMLIYIYARQDNTNSNAIIDKLLKEDTDSNEMLYYVERSKHLAEIFSARDLSACEKYLIMLIGDSKKRAFNRAFQLAYYGDRNHDFGLGLTNVDAFIDDIHAGLDFNNFFCAVSSKIHLSIASKKRYKLLEYDLFMLCDFIYSRLLQVKIDNPEIDEKSFFYNKRYNSKTAKDAHEVLEESIN